MKQSVTIKSFPNGIEVILDPNVPFEELYVAYAEKFRDSAKFFGEAKVALSFDGRELSDLEERALIEAIGEYTDVTVLCVLEKNKESNDIYVKAAKAYSPSGESDNCSVYKGTLHAGQHLETDGSVIVLGDVNPGASVSAVGSIVIIGTVYGDVEAGISGDEGSFVSALGLSTECIQVAGLQCKIFTKSMGFLRKTNGPKIIYVVDHEIMCDDVTKEFLADIPF